MNLILEVNEKFVPANTTLTSNGGYVIMVTPPLDENYWAFRVKFGRYDQAILGFPKFGTIGIGFAKEKDWNTNLPYTCETEEILAHIKHNKGCPIKDDDVRVAIRMVQDAAVAYKQSTVTR